MTKVRQQILDVMRVIYNEAQLNPEGITFQIPRDKIRKYPDHSAILEKLEKQYKVVSIERRPDEDNYGAADLSMFQDDASPTEFDKYMSYFITVKPTFDAFYDKHYADNSVNIPSLNMKNFWIVFDTAEQIDDSVNISPSNHVSIKASKAGSYLFNAGYKELSYDDIILCKQKALEFLKGQNALKSFVAETYEETDFGKTYDVIENYNIEVNRHVFAEVFTELKSYLEKYSKNLSANEVQENEVHQITFDEKDEKLRNNSKSIDVGSGTIEFYILKALFKMPIGQGTSITDIIDEWGGSENKQTIYDAITRLNKKFRQLLGTTSIETKVVYQKSSIVYFDKKYSDSISTHN